MFGTQKYSSDVQTNLCYLVKARMKILLNSKIKLKMKYFEGRSVLMENFTNEHFGNLVFRNLAGSCL